MTWCVACGDSNEDRRNFLPPREGMQSLILMRSSAARCGLIFVFSVLLYSRYSDLGLLVARQDHCTQIGRVAKSLSLNSQQSPAAPVAIDEREPPAALRGAYSRTVFWTWNFGRILRARIVGCLLRTKNGALRIRELRDWSV